MKAPVFLACSLFLLGSSGPALAASLLLHADTTNAANVPNVVSTIDGTGILQDPVAAFNGVAGTPTLAQLQAYDSVLVWANDSFSDGEELGDVLADYADGGGGVVIATFANAPGEVDGEFASGGYHPITPAAPSFGPANLTLGNTPVPTHPVLNGVVGFDGGGQSFRSSGSAAAGTTLVAEWSNGDPLVVENTAFAAPIIALNFLPPSSEVGSWLASTDGGLMMANALAYTAGQPIPEPIFVGFLIISLGYVLILRRRTPPVR